MGQRFSVIALKVFQPDAAPGAQALARLRDATKETRIILQPVIEPVVLRGEADQHAGRLAVTGDDDVLLLSLAQEMRKIVLHRGQRDFLHAGLPNWASHESASDLLTIAR